MKITHFRECPILPQPYQQDKQYHMGARQQDAGLGTIEAREKLTMK